jgi:tetratricopeptide (TPR) repeat protein
MVRFRQVKSEIARRVEDLKRSFKQRRENKKARPAPQDGQFHTAWKRLILGVLVGTSIAVVVSWTLFTLKPAWRAPVQRLIASDQTHQKKKFQVYPPHKRVSKAATTKTHKTTTRPPMTPKAGQGQSTAAQTERPQTPSSQPPPAMPPSTTPSVKRPHVSIPSGPRGSKEVQRPTVTTPAPTFPVKKEESELEDYLEIGTLYAQKGAYEKAENLFLRVTKDDPSSAQARNNLGFVYLKQEKYNQAEKEFKEALRIDPALVLPYYNLACLYSRKGMEVRALIYLRRALKRDARVKVWARTDEDFGGLRSDVVFQELLGITSPEGQGAQEATR